MGLSGKIIIWKQVTVQFLGYAVGKRMNEKK